MATTNELLERLVQKTSPTTVTNMIPFYYEAIVTDETTPVQLNAIYLKSARVEIIIERDHAKIFTDAIIDNRPDVRYLHINAASVATVSSTSGIPASHGDIIILENQTSMSYFAIISALDMNHTIAHVIYYQ